MTRFLQGATLAAGWLALLLVLLLGAGTVLAVLGQADAGGAGSAAVPGGVVAFTLWQALLSAAFSAALAVPLAQALFRLRFRGRAVLIAALAAPVLLPSLAAVMGLLAVFGRAGIVSQALDQFGLPRIDIFGLTGVVLAHVFFNLPLVTRMLLQGWSDIPPEHFRLAAQLGLTGAARFRILTLPMLLRVLPGAVMLVFLLCCTSFAIVLTLGGGPAATTLEVAIYQALRFDFDLDLAARLALIQLAICLVAALLAAGLAPPAGPGLTRLAGPQPGMTATGGALAVQAACVALSALFLMTPILLLVWRGLPALWQGVPAAVWPATLRSLAVASASAALTLVLGLALAGLIERTGRRHHVLSWALHLASLMTLAVSPFVMGTGLFILIRPLADPVALALPVTVAVNAGLSLPLAVRLLVPALALARSRSGRLANSLGMEGLARFRLATWPQIRQPALLATGIAAALSMGDLGVIALFSAPGAGTLPMVMQRLMASYQMEAAAGVAVLLMALSFGLFWIIDRGGRLGN